MLLLPDESEMKSAATSEHLQEVHLKRISLDPTKDSEPVTPSPSPVSISTEHSENTAATTPQKSALVSTSSLAPPFQSRWRQLLCCVPSRAKIPEHPPNQRPIVSRGDSAQTVPIQSSTVPEVRTKITKSSKWTSLFKKPKNVSSTVSANGSKKSKKVKLRSVKMVPQAADERLKSPAPTLLITRHEANSAGIAVACVSDNLHHGEENGVAGYHINLDGRMSESVHSQDSQHSDDSYLEPVDQVSVAAVCFDCQIDISITHFSWGD